MSDRQLPKWSELKPLLRPKLAEPPSTYLRRQVHAAFMDDPVALANVDRVGAGCLLWGNDYPHEEGLFPRSREITARTGAHLAEEDRRPRLSVSSAAGSPGAS